MNACRGPIDANEFQRVERTYPLSLPGDHESRQGDRKDDFTHDSVLARIGANPCHELSVAALIRTHGPISYGCSCDQLTPGKVTSMSRFGAIRASIGSLIVTLAMIAVTGCDVANSTAAPTVTITPPPATNATAVDAVSPTATVLAAARKSSSAVTRSFSR